MDDLERALGDLSDIRRQLAQSTEFRGLGPATLATSAVLAVAGATVEALWLRDPARHLSAYLAVWIATAAGVLAVAGAQLYTRARRLHSGLPDEMLHSAVEQFLPAFGTGSLLTLLFALDLRGAAWMLPGLWQIVFSLGVFASCRYLPKAMPVAGFWYLLTGLLTLSLGDTRTFSPWVMGVAFGCGQLVIAAVLYFAHYGDSHAR